MSDKNIQLPDEISVRQLATILGVDPTTVIGKLVAGGVMASVNQNIDYDSAALISQEFGFTPEALVVSNVRMPKAFVTKHSVVRPPIITIMGHVDHGKTSLLDYIRSSNVAAGEAGGITQHISANQIEFSGTDKQKRKITFIDTPGHEAFSALRSHGASITDLVVLVVAADDGIKPQTEEAVKFARAANVPIIVALNKADLPSANPERVKQQLVELDLAPEDWGGKTVVVPISAKTGQGVDSLLELITLTTDLLELKADPEALGEGIVIEANLDKQTGPLARVLVYNGTLRAGQVVVVGDTYGRIRTLEDERGQKIPSALPAFPALITGLKDVPRFGDTLQVVPNEKVAKSITASAKGATSRSSTESENSLRVVLKADVGGSLAALEDSIKKLKVKDATVEIVSSGIGAVNENDLSSAKASGAILVAFRSSPIKRVAVLAQKDEIEIKESWIIYEIIDFLTEKLHKIATPTFITLELGRLKVLEVFSYRKGQGIVGGEVTEGTIKGNVDVTVLRGKEEIGTAKVTTLKMGKIDVDQVEKGSQCGLNLIEMSTEIERGDVLKLTETVQEK